MDTNLTKKLDTPIVFIIFNRLGYATQVFEKIRKARPSMLLVIADGPRTPEEKNKTDAVRALIDMVDWPCTIHKNYSETNLGLKDRFTTGLGWVFDRVEKAIILEDDCLPDMSFFYFCETLLEKYRNDPRIMMISGDNPLQNYKMKTSYDFSRYFAIWGWATWSRAWKLYKPTLDDWPQLRKEKWLRKAYSYSGIIKNLTLTFDKIYQGKTDTWDGQWVYACIKNNGLCIVPQVNLVSNIGVEGVHSSPGENNNVPLGQIDTRRLIGPEKLEVNQDYDMAFFKANFHPKPWTDMRSRILKVLVRVKRVFRKVGLVK